MFAIAVTLALFGFAASMLIAMVRRDSCKIVAALQGNSPTALPPRSVRPVTIRFNQRYPASRPMWVRPALRAAA